MERTGIILELVANFLVAFMDYQLPGMDLAG
jgi:hypothetical protein